MPIANSPESEAITEEERAVIKEWVKTGATYGVPPSETSPRSKAERMSDKTRWRKSLTELLTLRVSPHVVLDP